MSLRRKTRTRLLILAGVVLLLMVSAGGIWLFRKHQLNQSLVEARAVGMTAIADEHYQVAFKKLGYYARRVPDDPEVWFNLAKARLNVEANNDKHIIEAIGQLRRAVELKPDYTEALAYLINLYAATGFNTETIEAATRYESLDPNNKEVVRAHAVALWRLRKTQEALQLAQRAIEIDPSDLDGYVLELLMMRSGGVAHELIIKRAEQVHQAHPDDPRFVLLQSIAYRIVNDQENALAWMREAAELTPPDTTFIRMLLKQFDAVGRYDESMQVLERSVKSQPDNLPLLDIYVRRLMELNRYRDALALVETFDPSERSTPAALAAYKATCQAVLGQTDEAKATIHAMQSRDQEPLVKAWLSVLPASLRLEELDPQELIQRLNRGKRLDSENATFRVFLGDTYAQINEQELALNAWREALSLAPSWALPLIRMARAELAAGRPIQAIQASQAALQRMPQSVDAAVSMVLGLSQTLDLEKTDIRQRFLDRIVHLQQVVNGEPLTLPIMVGLQLASDQREPAIKTIEQVLAQEQPTSGDMLLKLADLSTKYQLGFDDALLAKYEKQFGKTPSLANMLASRLIAQNKTEQALALFADPPATASTQQKIAWSLARARTLDVVNDPQAQQAWIKLGDMYPQDLEVQRQALESPSISQDREFQDRTIERLKTLTGEQGVAWRIARARWLLADKPKNPDIARAATLLNELVRISPQMLEARLLLARCMEALGNLPAAIEQLRMASELDSANSRITMDLARLLQLQGEFDQASMELSRVMESGLQSEAERQQAAVLLAQQGKTQQALQLLESGERSTQDRNTQLLVAQLYARLGETSRAKEMIEQLMKQPDPATIRFAATLLASMDLMPEAQQYLKKLDELNLAAGVADMIRADFTARFVGIASAEPLYQSVVQAAPDNLRAWERLMACQLYAGEMEGALVTAENWLKVMPQNTIISFFRQHGELLKQMSADAQLRPLIYSILDEPSYRQSAVDALKIAAESKRLNETTAQLVTRLRPLADRQIRFESLQILIGALYLQNRQHDEAATVARRAMQNFPTSADAAQQATIALRSLGRWSEALVAAQGWRERLGSSAGSADMVIAEAYRRLNNPSASLQVLEPYIDAAMANPKQYAQVIVAYAQSLIMAGRATQAETMIWPLAESAREWRYAYMRLTLMLPNGNRWLEKIATLVPADADEELLFLAQSWLNWGQSRNNSQAIETGRTMITQLSSKPNPSVAALSAQAMQALGDGKLDLAETLYRRILEAQPDNHAVANNLAYVLQDQNQELEFALKLATQAITAEPDNTSYLDTVAKVCAKLKQVDQADAYMQRAIQLQPQELMWRVNLVQMLLDASQLDRAQRAMQGIENLVPSINVSQEQRQQIEDLRNRFTQAEVKTGI